MTLQQTINDAESRLNEINRLLDLNNKAPKNHLSKPPIAPSEQGDLEKVQTKVKSLRDALLKAQANEDHVLEQDAYKTFRDWREGPVGAVLWDRFSELRKSNPRPTVQAETKKRRAPKGLRVKLSEQEVEERWELAQRVLDDMNKQLSRWKITQDKNRRGTGWGEDGAGGLGQRLPDGTSAFLLILSNETGAGWRLDNSTSTGVSMRHGPTYIYHL